jgi:WD40 repeat protein
MHYSQRNICFVVFEDCKIFIFNYLSKQIVGIYKAPVMSHDTTIGFALHCSGNYFATASKCGQITFWHLDEKALAAIERSEELVTKRRRRGEEEFGEEIEEEVWGFRAKDRVVNIFPMTAVHSASVTGLKWIGFMGNLLALITETGIFKLIAINFDFKDEYMLLIEYPIPEGEAITTVQFFPDEETLVVFKGRSYLRLKEPQDMSELTDEQIRIQERMLASDSNYYKTNFNGLERRSCEDNCMEILTFGSELRVESV